MRADFSPTCDRDTGCLTALSYYIQERIMLEKLMRMPILTYFLVIGALLFGGLILVSSQLESKSLPVSQRIGVPAPFKAPPDANGSPTSSNLQ
jgi:hypothetical protein